MDPPFQLAIISWHGDAVATAGDAIPELVAEMRQRNVRIRKLEAALAASSRTPAMAREIIEKAEAAVHAKLSNLRESLGNDPLATREIYRALFPDGLTFKPAECASRRVWHISGTARIDGVKLKSDPNGIRRRVKPHETERDRYHPDGEFGSCLGFAHRHAASL
jgi:hypothetical protein